MGYCVIERGTDDSLRFVVQGVFPTREAARDALGAALADGSVSLAGDVCVADLDAATPVLVVLLAAPEIEQPIEPLTTPEVEPAIERLTTPEGEPAIEPLVTEAESPVYMELDVAEAPSAVEPPAVEYVAPEPVVLEPIPAAPVSAGWDSAALDIQEAPGASLADALRRATVSLEEEGIVAPASIESAAAGAVADIEWPEVTADPLGAFSSMGALEEPAVEAAPIIKNAPAEGEDAYLPRPVILGDYPDAPPAPGAGWVEAGAAARGNDIDFAVSGDLQLESYTCDDCVYSNTCPKVGKTAPAECGAFQWRSE